MNTADNAERLWDLTQQRADELGKELQEIAQEAGVSIRTLYEWRKGNRVRGSNDRAIHRAFRWEPGSRDAILGSGRATPLAEVAHPEHAPPTSADLDAEIEERVEWFRCLPLDKRRQAFRDLFDDLLREIDPGAGGEGRRDNAG